MGLVQMCVQGTAMIAVVVLVRAVCLKRLPKATFLVLWGLVLVRLLVPFSLPAPLGANVWTLVERAAAPLGASLEPVAAVPDPVAPTAAGGSGEEGPGEAPVVASPSDASPAAGSAPRADGAATADQGTVSKAARWGGLPWWTVVWSVGSAALVCAVAVSYARHFRRFAAAVPVAHPSARRWLAAHRLRRRLRLHESALVDSPITYGVLRPTIVVPVGFDWDDPSKSTLVLEHEFVHVVRFDAVFKALLTAATCLYWFDPLVWAMYLLANRDIELSCDERVALRLNHVGRSLYAHALIDAVESHSLPRFPAPAGFGRNALEERVVALTQVRTHTVPTGLATVALCACLLLGFATTLPLGTVDLPLSRPVSTTPVLESTDIPASGNDLVAVYSVSDGVRLATPHYSVEVPRALLSGDPVWDFSEEHVDPAPAGSDNVLVVRDGATGEVALMTYLVDGEPASQDPVGISVPGYTCETRGSIQSTASPHTLVLALPEGSPVGEEQGTQPRCAPIGLAQTVWGLDESYAAYAAFADDEAGVLQTSSSPDAYLVHASAEEDGTRIEGPFFSLLLPQEFMDEGPKLGYRQDTSTDGRSFGELVVRLPDGNGFTVTTTDAGYDNGGSHPFVQLPAAAGAPQGMRVYVTLLSSVTSEQPGEDVATYAGWVSATAS